MRSHRGKSDCAGRLCRLHARVNFPAATSHYKHNRRCCSGTRPRALHPSRTRPSRPMQQAGAARGLMKSSFHAIFQARGRRQTSNQMQRCFSFSCSSSKCGACLRIKGILRMRIHRRFLECCSRSAIRFRARNSRERTLDSVIPRTEAISTLVNSSNAERTITSRSFVGSRSTQERTWA